MTTIDPITGYNHVIKKEIWEGYLQKKLLALVSNCRLEWIPGVEGFVLHDPKKPNCPECFKDNKLSTHLKASTATPLSFIQLPVMVEAMQLTEDVQGRVLAIIAWGRDNGCNMTYNGKNRGLLIRGRDGTFTARENDWIVKRLDGIFVPMRPDTFWASYEVQ